MANRLRWAGHVMRMKENEHARKILKNSQKENGGVRWTDDVAKNLRNWRMVAQDWSEWR